MRGGNWVGIFTRVSKEETKGAAAAKLVVNPGGFGFAERLDGEGTVFIPRVRMGGALDGDEVEVHSWPSEKGFEGEIVRIVRRGRTRLTGQVRRIGRVRVLECDDPRVLLRPDVEDDTPVPEDIVVVAAITRYPFDNRDGGVVRIERLLGPPNTLATEQAKILLEYNIDPEFASDVLAEAEAVPETVQPEDLANRADLRGLEFMTIDPVDARDFDDAVCVEAIAGEGSHGAVRVHVAVADVSHYVREGTAIDREAAWRCFSCYLPNRSIPMLPRALSSHMCSLVPEQDRLAMVASFRLEADGEIDELVLRAAVIHSRKRLTYEEVAAVLSDETGTQATQPPEVCSRIAALRAAADQLRARRLRRGAIELNVPEIKVLLDQDDPERIRDIVPTRASAELARAYNLIEELMLAANEAVGRVAVGAKLPLVYRIHAPPDPARLEQLATVAEALGAKADPEKLTTPRGAQKFLNRTQNHPRRAALHMFMLRAMAQAQYSVDNVGHFALASDAYAHFTSPIRRYPDLIVHRVLKAHLAKIGGLPGPEPVPAMPQREQTAEQSVRSSLRERAVADAERDSKSLFAALFLRDRVGDRFEATVSGIGAPGVFVQVDRPFVDGLVRLGNLERDRGEVFQLDTSGVKLVGQRSGFTLTVGDRLVVEVIDSSVQRRKIEFAFVMRLSEGTGKHER
nr:MULTISPECIES: VacB/RNase II family 3'-5' exoribonuclease [unclassified Nannocystis]